MHAYDTKHSDCQILEIPPVPKLRAEFISISPDLEGVMERPHCSRQEAKDYR